jgi:hypothetical protein
MHPAHPGGHRRPPRARTIAAGHRPVQPSPIPVQAAAVRRRSPGYDTARETTRTNIVAVHIEASLCQGVRPVFLRVCEVSFGLCVLASGSWPGAFLAAECGRRLAAPPGRSSSLRCGRSTWTRGFAGGDGTAAAGERPGVPGELAAVVVWWRGPGVAFPKSRSLGCKPAALASEPFPGCPPGSFPRAAARRAPACRQAKMALLTCRFSDRSASFGVLPPASFLS